MAFFYYEGSHGRLDRHVRHTGGAVDTVQRVRGEWLLPTVFYGFFLLWISFMPQAHADEYMPTFKWRSDSYSGFFPDRDTYQQVLEDNKTKLNETGANYELVETQVLDENTVNGRYTDGGWPIFDRGAYRVASCPYGGSLTGSAAQNNQRCVDAPPCADGQTRQSNGSCAAPPDCQQGRLLESGPFADSDGDGVLPPLSCIRGCYAHLTNGGGAPQMDCSIGGAGTIGVCTYVLPGDYIDQGESCSPDNSPTKTPPADRGPCPACDCMQSGGSWGQINGVDACMPRGAAGTLPVQTKPAPTIKEDKPKPTPENPNPEGTKTVTPSPTVTVIPNPNGGEPTVKEETTNPDGSTTTTTSTMGEYCKNNATSSTCKATGTGAGGSGGGDFKGSCEMGYVCTGDGVQCAIAKKIHQNRCDDLAELKEFEPAAEEGRRILMGEEDPEIKSWMNKEGDHKRTINLADEVKETGDYQFAAQCIADVQFSIGGHSITVPFSKLCPYFEMIGYILLAASYLYALRIVGIW